MRKILTFFILFLFILPTLVVNAEELSGKLKGKILLQVQSHGEAWYVSSESKTRFYLGRPDDAFRVMREQGLGISNNDFDFFKGTAPARLSGKILIKVEDSGKAYYVNPVDLKIYYLGRPADAFSVMRNLGMGISNSDLALILINEKSRPVIVEEKTVKEEAAQKPEAGETATDTDDIAPKNEIATTTEEVISNETGATSTSACVWRAEYYDNYRLFGEPVLTRQEEKINYNWGVDVPEGLGKKDKFSVRWTSTCFFAEGVYEFRTAFDDAIKVYLDGENFLQSWTDNAREKKINRERSVTEGEHTVKVEYYDQLGKASVSVDWVKL